MGTADSSNSIPDSTVPDSIFRELVDIIARSRNSANTIACAIPRRAAVVMEHFFKQAHEKVCILTPDLQEAIYATPEVIAAATHFLRNDSMGKIELLVKEGFDAAAHPLITALRAAGFQDRVDLWSVPKHILIGCGGNFAVADARHVRMQTTDTTAIAHFWNPKLGADVQGIFDDVKSRSRSLPLTIGGRPQRAEMHATA